MSFGSEHPEKLDAMTVNAITRLLESLMFETWGQEDADYDYLHKVAEVLFFEAPGKVRDVLVDVTAGDIDWSEMYNV